MSASGYTYIITGERTLANYLIKPLADQMQRGLRVAMSEQEYRRVYC